jgi:hypothetical protein
MQIFSMLYFVERREFLSIRRNESGDVGSSLTLYLLCDMRLVVTHAQRSSELLCGAPARAEASQEKS